MTRHAIVGMLGADDPYTPAENDEEVLTEVQLADDRRRLNFGIGDLLADVRDARIVPSEIGVDLLVIAALVYAADTRIERKTQSQDNWTREIRISAPVSDVDRWRGASPTLKRLLQFLTGDIWTLEFRSRPRRFTTLATRIPFGRVTACEQVNLFSGGLDSLVGAIDAIEDEESPIFVSHASEGASSKAQEACFTGLMEAYPDVELTRLRMWMSFPKDLVAGSKSDDTTRGRSFLFFALGVFVASSTDEFQLVVPENGLIAINVPLDPLRLGSLSTRTTHPFYIARWHDLLAELDLDGEISNPYRAMTKGEMLESCENTSLLKELLTLSMSCSSPTKGRWQGLGIQHCGYCTPCLIRRAAVRAAFPQWQDPTTYTEEDLTEHPLDTRKAEGQQIRSFKMAIRRIEESPSIAKLLIRKPGPLVDVPEQLDELADVYVRGMKEVGRFLRRVKASPA